MKATWHSLQGASITTYLEQSDALFAEPQAQSSNMMLFFSVCEARPTLAVAEEPSSVSHTPLPAKKRDVRIAGPSAASQVHSRTVSFVNSHLSVLQPRFPMSADLSDAKKMVAGPAIGSTLFGAGNAGC